MMYVLWEIVYISIIINGDLKRATTEVIIFLTVPDLGCTIHFNEEALPDDKGQTSTMSAALQDMQ